MCLCVCVCMCECLYMWVRMYVGARALLMRAIKMSNLNAENKWKYFLGYLKNIYTHIYLIYMYVFFILSVYIFIFSISKMFGLHLKKKLLHLSSRDMLYQFYLNAAYFYYFFLHYYYYHHLNNANIHTHRKNNIHTHTHAYTQNDTN